MVVEYILQKTNIEGNIDGFSCLTSAGIWYYACIVQMNTIAYGLLFPYFFFDGGSNA
jgi:hypothetical protein